MKPGIRLLLLLSAVVCVVILVVWVLRSVPAYPVALIQVVDAAGKSVAGAVIKPDGLRPKPGNYSSGHYAWTTNRSDVVPAPVVTRSDGYARVPYPKYVLERIETGEISFSVSHPDFVPDRPFRTVTGTPPAGSPWRVWADYLWNRVRLKAPTVRPDPVVLQKGSILKLLVGPNSAAPKDALLFAQASAQGFQETNFWFRPEPGVLITRRLAAGPQTVRAVQLNSSDSAWFSDVISITAVAGQTNEVVVHLKPGVAIHGQLDATVPRPVTNGRVVANVWPQGHKAQNSPPRWHAWTTLRDDGSFDIGSLPEGDLEIVALCNGFVSTNHPGQFPTTRYPQKHLLGTNDITITIGMEPTARLEVQVTDDKGNPLKDAKVFTWPNVRYGDWSSTILIGDCYNTVDQLLKRPTGKSLAWWQEVPDFQGTSDNAGLAVVPNLPVTVNEFTVEHPRFVLPAVLTPGGDKRRQASVTLRPGQTNRVSAQLEPRVRSPMAHY